MHRKLFPVGRWHKRSYRKLISLRFIGRCLTLPFIKSADIVHCILMQTKVCMPSVYINHSWPCLTVPWLRKQYKSVLITMSWLTASLKSVYIILCLVISTVHCMLALQIPWKHSYQIFCSGCYRNHVADKIRNQSMYTLTSCCGSLITNVECWQLNLWQQINRKWFEFLYTSSNNGFIRLYPDTLQLKCNYHSECWCCFLPCH